MLWALAYSKERAIIEAMSGHSKWSQIKHKKGITDKKRAVLFSKLLAAISAAARTEPNPEYNPRLRSAIDTAREAHVPQDNIERAVKRSLDAGELEDLTFEAYGPGGAAIFVTAITNSRNRTVNEIKHLLATTGGKWAETGSVAWAFDAINKESGTEWVAKFPQEISLEDQAGLETLLEALDDHPDIQDIYTNAKLE